jgi:hypothetical protein
MRHSVLPLLVFLALLCGMMALQGRRSVYTVSDSPSQGTSGIYELFITCNADSLYLIQEHYAQDIYIMADVTMAGRQWRKVPLRIRGDSSREFPKKSLKLKFPKADPFMDGRWTLNLNGEYLDSTYLRQSIATRMFAEAGVPCFSTRHALVHINGALHGLFLVVENMDEQFMRKWGLDPKSDLYKATRDKASLSWGEDLKLLWEKKANEKDSVWTPLERLVNQLNLTPDAEYYALVQRIFDYDRLVSALAVNMLIGNRSTYYHNYFVCRDPKTFRWIYMPWDLDNTFIVNKVADPYQRGNNSDSWDAIMASNPLFERALVTPEILRDIQKRVAELADRYFNPAFTDPLIDSLGKVVAPHIPADTFYRKRDPQYWQREVEALRGYVKERPGILMRQFAHSPTSFRLIRPQRPFKEAVTLNWRASHDADGDALRYNLVFSPSPYFHKDSTTRYDGLQDTVFTLPVLPRAGRYYWKVSVTDGDYYIRGFDNVVLFEVK